MSNAVTIATNPPTTEQTKAYVEAQQLHSLLEAALQQVVNEQAPNGPQRLAELIKKAANERDNEAKMKELFDIADSDHSGLISKEELGKFKETMGEPLAAPELEAAYASMGGNDTGGVGFVAFAAWYDTNRANTKKGEAAVLRKTRAAKASRRASVSTKEDLDAINASFDPTAVKVTTKGQPATLEYRVGFELLEKPISPWHDVPLYPDPSIGAKGAEVNMIVEIPKWSRAKFEIATGEDHNPIKQDTKKGRLREYTYGDMLFNYGCFPQTWEDPSHKTEDTGAIGDNDPIDAMEIGTQIFETGAIVKVKVLGCLAMIDDGETDWKVVCISTEDPLAEKLDDISDVEKVMPGYIGVMREWLRMYKTPDGKPKNTFGLEEKAMDKEYTMGVVEETHVFWQNLMTKGQTTV